jgi:hypothetical protein
MVVLLLLLLLLLHVCRVSGRTIVKQKVLGIYT